MAELSHRNLELLMAIQTIQDESGFTPTVRELGLRVGLSSPSTVHGHLRKLERALLVERRGQRLRITDRGRDVLVAVAG